MVPVIASRTEIATGTAAFLTPFPISNARGAIFLLSVTAAATAAGDTLDVYLQAAIDGTNYCDVVKFTQVLGNGGAKVFLARWLRDISPTVTQGAPQNKAMSAGVNLGPAGDTWRAAWTITSASAPSFTFSVSAAPFY